MPIKINSHLKDKILFSLQHNSKKPKFVWKDIDETKIQHEGHDNIACLTGYKNNITVLDLDFPRYDMASVFVEQFGDDYIREIDTLTVRSANGGYHLYFLYEPEIKTSTNNLHQIDVRNDGAYIVAPPSSINGNSYTVKHNTPIKRMPPQLKEWCMSNIVSSKSKGLKLVKRGAKRVNSVGKNVYGCRISAGELASILAKLPVDGKRSEDYRGDYALWFRVGLACCFTGHFEPFDTWSKGTKHGNYDADALAEQWGVWKSCAQVFHFQWLLHTTSTRNYYTFKQVHSKLEAYTSINKAKLDDIKSDTRFFKAGRHYMIKSDTGTGKTTAFLKYIQEQKTPFISLVSRVVLGLEQADNMERAGIDVKLYQDKTFQYGDNIIITPESAPIILNYDFSKYIVFLDEFDSIIRHITTSTTLNRNRVKAFGALIKMLATCKQFIAVDADISVISQHLVQQVGRKYSFYWNEFKNYNATRVQFVNDEAEFFNMVKQEETYLLATDSKSTADVLRLKAETDTGKDVKLITSDTPDTERIDLDAYDRAIYSPKLLYGLDSTRRRKVFAHYKGHTISPTAMVQQITRCRDIEAVFIHMKAQESLPCMYDTMKEMATAYKESITRMNAEIDALYEDEEDEEQKPFIDEAERLYNHLFYMVNYMEDCYATNKFLHLTDIMSARGFVLDIPERHDVSHMKMADVKKMLKGIREEAFDPQHPVVKRLNEILRVKPADMRDYVEFFTDSSKLEKHFNWSAYFKQTTKDNLERLETREDFDLSKCKDRSLKFKLLDDMLGVIGTSKDAIQDYLPTKTEVGEATATDLVKRYRALFRVSRKAVAMNTHNEVFDIVKSIYRNMFDVVGTKQVRVDGDRVQVLKLKTKEIEQHQKLYECRTRKKIVKLV